MTKYNFESQQIRENVSFSRDLKMKINKPDIILTVLGGIELYMSRSRTLIHVT